MLALLGSQIGTGHMTWRQKLNLLMSAWEESNVGLARDLGVDNSQVSRWRSGKNEIKRPEMVALSRHYRLSLDQLFNDDVELPSEMSRTRTVRLDAASGQAAARGAAEAASQSVSASREKMRKQNRRGNRPKS